MAAARTIIDRLVLTESPDVFNGRSYADDDAIAFTITADGKYIAYGSRKTHSEIVAAIKNYLLWDKPAPAGITLPDSVGARLIAKPTKGPGIVMGRVWTDFPAQISFWDDADSVPKAVYDRLYREFKLKEPEIDPFDGSNIGKALNVLGPRD
jgi:hypothetical protein